MQNAYCRTQKMLAQVTKIIVNDDTQNIDVPQIKMHD